ADTVVELPEGATLNECYALLNADDRLKSLVVAFHNGAIQEDWETITHTGEVVIFAIIPKGSDDGNGKQVIAMVAMMAIMIIAPYAGAAMTAMIPLETFASVAALNATTAVFTAGIGIVGSLAVAAIFKPDLPSLNAPVTGLMSVDSAAPALIVGQSNQAKPLGMIPVIFGEMEIFPDLAATPYIEKLGCAQTLHALYCCGSGVTLVDTATARLGGVLISELNRAMAEKGRQIEIAVTTVLAGSSYISRLGYTGIRKIDQVGLVFNEYVPAVNNDLIVIPSASSDKVYLDIIFPRGIFRTTDLGMRAERTATIGVQVYEHGAYRDLETKDLWAQDLSQLVCKGDDNETTVSGDITTEFSFTTSWGITMSILDSGIGGGGGDNTFDIARADGVICGSSSGSSTKSAGWNAGVEGRMTFPHVCGPNGKNAITQTVEDIPTGITYHEARINDLTQNGNIYYTMAYDSVHGLADGTSFGEGYYQIILEVAQIVEADIDVMMCHFFVNGLDAQGRKIDAQGNLTTNALLTPVVKRYATTRKPTAYYASFTLGKGTAYKRLQFGLTFDYDETRSPTNPGRRGVVRIESLKAEYTPIVDTTTPVIEIESKIKIKVPVKTAGDANSFGVETPIVGDILYWGYPQQDNCSTCFPMGKIFMSPTIWDTEWSPGTGLIKYPYYSFIRPDGQGIHQILKADLVETNVDVNLQLWHIYELSLDNPISHIRPSVYFKRISSPGFKITAAYNAPIHFGLMLKWFEKYKLAKVDPVPDRAVESAILNSVSSIQSAGIAINAPQDELLTYSIVELSVPASETMGQTIKPFSISVHRGGRDMSADFYDIALRHGPEGGWQGNPGTPGGQVKNAAMDMTQNPAWAY
ncbi:MAG: hypothetical protein DRN17_06335, partial [Thermoplasmata archaeon]